MKILITGGSGFVGHRTALRAIHHHELVIAGRGPNPPASLKGLEFEYRQVDYLDLEQCKKACVEIDAVIHCAGKAGAWGPFDEYEKGNVTTTKNLVAAAKESGVRRFINISSASVYFQLKDLFGLKEDQIPSPLYNAYSVTKYEAEKIVSEAHSSDFLTASLRPRGVIGAGDTSWLPRIIELAKANQLRTFGEGKNVVHFTSISNLIDAIEICLAASPRVMGEVYNITNGADEELHTVIDAALELLEIKTTKKKVSLGTAMWLAKMSEKWHTFRKTEKEPLLLPLKIGVAAYSMTLDISKAQSNLGYRPRQSTGAALQEFARWYGQPA